MISEGFSCTIWNCDGFHFEFSFQFAHITLKLFFAAFLLEFATLFKTRVMLKLLLAWISDFSARPNFELRVLMYHDMLHVCIKLGHHRHRCLVFTIWFEWPLHQWENQTDPRLTNQKCCLLVPWKHKCCLMFTIRFENLTGVPLYTGIARWNVDFFSTGSSLFLDVCKWCGIDHLSVFCVENLLRDCWEWSTVEESNLGDGGHHLHSTH